MKILTGEQAKELLLQALPTLAPKLKATHVRVGSWKCPSKGSSLLDLIYWERSVLADRDVDMLRADGHPIDIYTGMGSTHCVTIWPKPSPVSSK